MRETSVPASDPTPAKSSTPSVLLIDDQREEVEALQVALRQSGFQVDAYNPNDPDSEEHRHLVDDVDVVVSKVRLDGNGEGIRTIRSWRRDRPNTPVIAITSEDNVDQAIEAMRVGAEDCLSQPVHPDELASTLRRALSLRRDEGVSLKSKEDATQSESLCGLEELVGCSDGMKRVFTMARRVAPTSSTVLISGPTGSGKDLLASAIHRLSRRRKGPFVAINIAAVPSTLVESELFGHVQGAFTDAAKEREGRFEAAEGGTLFIDEIGDLKLHSQAKLLRVLESRVINRVGSNEDRPVNVRVLAATSRDLESLIARGQFREDLYYRLNVVRIEVPALRQRQTDIPLLVEHFLQTHASEQQQRPRRVDPELMEFLQSHPWPGNVRQLKNCLESMIVMSDAEVLTLKDLPDAMEREARPQTLCELPLAGHALSDIEQQAIFQTLKQNVGNRTRTAQMLGISVRTLQRKLKQNPPVALES